jgi:hypothetical protein
VREEDKAEPSTPGLTDHRTESEAPEVLDAPAPAEDSSLPEDPELDDQGRPREP